MSIALPAMPCTKPSSKCRDCKVDSITSSDDYYFNWKTIHPDAAPYTDASVDKVIQEHRPQEQLVQGMLRPQRLLDITRSYTLFMNACNVRIKVICRYQQYRAVYKILDRKRNGNNGAERSGVIWHTQGSGGYPLYLQVIALLGLFPKCCITINWVFVLNIPPLKTLSF